MGALMLVRPARSGTTSRASAVSSDGPHRSASPLRLVARAATSWRAWWPKLGRYLPYLRASDRREGHHTHDDRVDVVELWVGGDHPHEIPAAGVIAATVGQVALLCAVLRGLSGDVVLTVVPVRVAEVQDETTAAEGRQQLRVSADFLARPVEQ